MPIPESYRYTVIMGNRCRVHTAVEERMTVTEDIEQARKDTLWHPLSVHQPSHDIQRGLE